MTTPDSTPPGVRAARDNIGALKVAIRKEKGTLADYRDRLKTGRGGFPEKGLRHGIERCEHNIKVLKDAIIRENASIRDLNGQQKICDEMAQLRVGIEIPVEHVNEDDVTDNSGAGEDTKH